MSAMLARDKLGSLKTIWQWLRTRPDRTTRDLAECADLLKSRMMALDLDCQEVARLAPEALHDLQRVCTLCSRRRRCARDLAGTPLDPHWKDYCPNVATLLALDAMPWAARSEW
jgi:hypothetical protein